MTKTRAFLASETLRQIKEGKLAKYIDDTKIRNKDAFRKYVEMFIQELESGVLSKRLPKSKIQEL